MLIKLPNVSLCNLQYIGALSHFPSISSVLPVTMEFFVDQKDGTSTITEGASIHAAGVQTGSGRMVGPTLSKAKQQCLSS